MVVRKEDSCAAQSCRIDDYVPDRQCGRFRLTLITSEMEATGGGIDMSHPQSLPRIPFLHEAGGKKAARGFLAVEDCGMFSALEPHGPNLLPVRRRS